MAHSTKSDICKFGVLSYMNWVERLEKSSGPKQRERFGDKPRFGLAVEAQRSAPTAGARQRLRREAQSLRVTTHSFTYMCDGAPN